MARTGLLSLSDRTVDLDTGLVSTGRRIRPLELRVLRLLAERLDQPVSATTLVSDGLGYVPHTRSHALYTTIWRLRAAIEADPAEPRHLVADRREGYRLVGARVGPDPEPALSNLAPERDAFVGRIRELARLDELEDVPLVSVVGPGGAGKTRLAVHHAATRPLSGGTWFAALDGADDALAAIHAAVVAQGPPSVDAIARRLAGLGPCRLILDDVDPVLDRAREVVEAVRAGAPEVRLRITGRGPLGVAGEHRVEVGPLDPADAVALLAARAREAGTSADPAVADELCARLDRLPLALELAAGWLATVPPDRIDPAGLRSLRADRPARHQDLDALVAWTWDSLDPADRTAIARLAVLEGPFGAEIAEVALDSGDAASALVRLHDRGLISASPLRRTRPFALLATVRAPIRARTSAEGSRRPFLPFALPTFLLDALSGR